MPKEIEELENRIQNLEERVNDLEENIAKMFEKELEENDVDDIEMTGSGKVARG